MRVGPRVGGGAPSAGADAVSFCWPRTFTSGGFFGCAAGGGGLAAFAGLPFGAAPADRENNATRTRKSAGRIRESRLKRTKGLTVKDALALSVGCMHTWCASFLFNLDIRMRVCVPILLLL